MNESLFLGRGWSFPPGFDRSERPTCLVSDEEDIRQSLTILLSTRTRERVFRPEYGSALHQFQFEEMTLTQETLLSDTLQKSILLYEPRVRLDRIVFNREQMKDGILRIELDYTVKMTNSKNNLVYPFYLDGKK